MGVMVISGRRRFFVPARIPSCFPGINMCRPLPQASVSFTLYLAKTDRRRSSTFSKLFTTSEREKMMLEGEVRIQKENGKCAKFFATDHGGFTAVARTVKAQLVKSYMLHML